MKPAIVRVDSLRRGAKFIDKFGRDTWTVTEVKPSGVVFVQRDSDGHKTCFAGCADAELVLRVTSEQIEALRVEAAIAVDMEQADLCTAALGGDAAAQRAFERAIADARAKE